MATDSTDSTDAIGRNHDTASDATDGATGEGPPYGCPYCDREFFRESYRALHLGQAHPGSLTDAERADYEAASEAESEELRLFRLKALAALVFIYFGFLLVYAFSL
jgi:hypothetical protein